MLHEMISNEEGGAARVGQSRDIVYQRIYVGVGQSRDIVYQRIYVRVG